MVSADEIKIGVKFGGCSLRYDEISEILLKHLGGNWLWCVTILTVSLFITSTNTLHAQNGTTSAQLGCDRGNAVDCFQASVDAYNSRGARDSNFIRYLRRSCELGYANGCSSLGQFTSRGEGVPRNPQVASQLFRKGCDGGSGYGCWRAASELLDQEPRTRASELQAISFFRRSLSAGGLSDEQVVIARTMISNWERNGRLSPR